MYELSSLQHCFMISHQLLVFRFRLSHPELIVHLGAESRFHDQSRQLSHMVGKMGGDCWTISKSFSENLAGQSSQTKLTFSRPFGPSQALSQELLPLALASRNGRISETGERSRKKEEEARRQICWAALQSLAHVMVRIHIHCLETQCEESRDLPAAKRPRRLPSRRRIPRPCLECPPAEPALREEQAPDPLARRCWLLGSRG